MLRGFPEPGGEPRCALSGLAQTRHLFYEIAAGRSARVHFPSSLERRALQGNLMGFQAISISPQLHPLPGLDARQMTDGDRVPVDELRRSPSQRGVSGRPTPCPSPLALCGGALWAVGGAEREAWGGGPSTGRASQRSLGRNVNGGREGRERPRAQVPRGGCSEQLGRARPWSYMDLISVLTPNPGDRQCLPQPIEEGKCLNCCQRNDTQITPPDIPGGKVPGAAWAEPKGRWGSFAEDELKVQGPGIELNRGPCRSGRKTGDS